MHSDKAAIWWGDYERKLAKTAAEESGAMRSNSTRQQARNYFWEVE